MEFFLKEKCEVIKSGSKILKWRSNEILFKCDQWEWEIFRVKNLWEDDGADWADSGV